MNEIPQFLLAVIAIRKDLHAHPGTGYQDERTSALVAKELRRLGIEFAEKIGKTRSGWDHPSSVAGIRSISLCADMEALSIQEVTGLPDGSLTERRMP